MTPILRFLAAFFAVLALPACQQLPESREAPNGLSIDSSAKLMPSAAAGGSVAALGSPYDAAIVTDLAIGADRPENLTGFDLANFEAIRPELARLFGTAFRETLRREGYVRVALSGESGADIVTIQPATMRVAPGYNVGGVEGVAATELEIAVAVRDAGGRLLGWYAVQYSGGLRSAQPVPRNDVLRRAFADAGEQVARTIAKAR
jgi:hypothetical protein